MFEQNCQLYSGEYSFCSGNHSCSMYVSFAASVFMYALSFSWGMQLLRLGQYLLVWNSKSSDSGAMISRFREYFFSFPDPSDRNRLQCSNCSTLGAIVFSFCSKSAAISRVVFGVSVTESIIARRVLFARAEKKS